jgi:hypothetical protein
MASGQHLGRVTDPDEVVRRWFDLWAEVGAVWLLLFTTMGISEGRLENRFLNLMAFSEGYHRALRDFAAADEKGRRGGPARRSAKRCRITATRSASFYRRLSHANSQDQHERLVELANDAKDHSGDHWDFDPDEQCRRMVDTRIG